MPSENTGTQRAELLQLLLTRAGYGSNQISRRPTVGPCPLSYAQERLWFLERLGLVGSAYTIPLAWRLQGVLDVAALQASLEALLQRHESLRTRFEERDGTPLQIIEPVGRLQLERQDWRALEPVERERRVQ